MFQTMALDLQKVEHKVVVLLFCNQEHVVSNQLGYQGSSLFWGNLKSIYSKRKKHFNDVFNIILVLGFYQLHFVFGHDCF